MPGVAATQGISDLRAAELATCSPGGGWLFTIVTGPVSRGAIDWQQVLIAPDDVPHKLHNDKSEENGQGPFQPLGQLVHDHIVSRQDAEQVLERPALDRMVGCQHHHARAGDVADKIAERGIDAQLLQFLATERVPNEIVHGLVLYD